MNTSIADLLTLPSVPLLKWREMPNSPGIYFVLAEERVLYIGRASSLILRWTTHHQWNYLTRLDADVRIAWFECSSKELLPRLEAALIRELKPELNGRKPASKGFRASTDISNAWEAPVLAYVQKREFITIGEILGQALQIETSKQSKTLQVAVADILKRFGWERHKRWVNGTNKRGWKRPNRSDSPLPDCSDRSSDRCEKPEKSVLSATPISAIT